MFILAAADEYAKYHKQYGNNNKCLMTSDDTRTGEKTDGTILQRSRSVRQHFQILTLCCEKL